MFAVVWVAFKFGRKYVFSNVKVNKWILLGIALSGLAAQALLKSVSPIINIGLTIVVVFFFMWFMDLQISGGPKKKEKQVVIKPKAKPNRAKHINKDNK